MTNQPDPEPIAIVDVQYFDDAASAACVVALRWSDASPHELQHCITRPVEPYEPGQFFRREMPPILAVLDRIATPIRTIIVDSYVTLDSLGSPGFGSHLYHHFAGRYIVIGVAKTRYKDADFAIPVTRGQSQRNLFVTAIGTSPQRAAQWITTMHGTYRIPTLLKLADRHARDRIP